MPFKSLLVALDGSEYSQLAAEYGIWLASELDASLAGQHVVDPRMVDLFIAPEFAEELGFSQSVETSEKVFRALKKIGALVLELFSKEAFARGHKTDTFLDVGYVVEEIVKRAERFDLLIMGHRGRGRKHMPGELMIGSLAERVVIDSSKPVLVALSRLDQLQEILVAYDGSEPAKGALLIGERLAAAVSKPFRALTVAPTSDQMPQAHLTVEQGESYLREYHDKDVFEILEGHTARTLLDYAAARNGLLVIGAYGYRQPDATVLGSTTAYLLRRARTSVLVYR
jgi:nucleotide-binding universal stress UspA family protein